MKKTIALSLLYANLFGFADNLNTFSAHFVQTVVDDKNTTIRYSGDIKAKRPNMAMWNYVEPIKKEIYINNEDLIIIEPEIEQVILKKVGNTIAFFEMLKHAKKIDNEHYTADYENMKLHIRIKGEKILSITYFDELENKVTIIFSDQVENKDIDDKEFKAKIPADFDVIYE
ncbi:LolA-like outer membrane lipoprotein chaperone [Sulfurimonas sp. HSL-1716]|uniref:LolA-like outer membrane lipoprotein chaperone n=1 Tax=Hydrocurvibacter sulfurireducens TaxID=3131937 RepID=UPI0031F7C544